ncbi:MAG: 50S ribosomal protein L22 [Candidatus Ornithospirochaeta sp.]|nr:50S ribosomal protein L22 [Candidatus Ornithospirochaeta sp.]
METKKGYKAIAKYVLVAPSKVRPVADLVRGKNYVEAVAILEAMPQKGARLILKVLKSAGANALNQNRKLDEDSLYVSTLKIDDGPRMKRVWARSHGKRDILLRRMSHITVVVDEKAAKVGE